MMSDAEARAVLLDAYALRELPPPKLGEVQIAQAIARFEGNYGAAFGDANNWGAVQCNHRAPCKAGCVEAKDHEADGTPYQGCFVVYDAPAAGAADFLRELYRRSGVPGAMRDGSATATARAMHASRYFEAPPDLYAQAIAGNAQTIAARIGEPLRVRLGAAPSYPAVMLGVFTAAASAAVAWWIARRAW